MPAPGSQAEDALRPGYLGGPRQDGRPGHQGPEFALRRNKRPYFEGGQLPLVRRLPHLAGFKNRWRIEYAPVNLERLNVFAAGTEVDPEMMVAGPDQVDPHLVKVLGDGEAERRADVKAHKFSASAREKILAAARKSTDAGRIAHE
jgi:large subunit ribosomal protein L15